MYSAASPCPKAFTQQFTAGALMAKFKDMLIAGEAAGESSSADAFSDDDVGFSDDDLEGLNGSQKNKATKQAEKIKDRAGAFTGILGSLIVEFLSLIAGATLSFIAALTFLAFGLFLLIRFVVLALLITFSPAIWLGFIFKGFKLGKGNIWSAWWGNFIKWTFFGPAIVLFLAFASEYLTSVVQNPVSVPAGGEFIQVAQLLSVIVISALGLVMAKSFSGAAGDLIMKGTSAGLGLVMNKANRSLQKKQLRDQEKAKEFRAQGKNFKASLLESRGKAYGGGIMGTQGTKGILKQIGVTPEFKSADEKELRQEIAHDKMRSAHRVTGFTKTKNFQTAIDKPKKVLALSDKDVENLSDEDKKSFVASLYELQKLPDGSLTAKETEILNKRLGAFEDKTAGVILKDVKIPAAVADARKLFNMSAKGMKTVLDKGNPDDINKVVTAISALETDLSMHPGSYTMDDINKIQELRRVFGKEVQKSILDNLTLSSPQDLLRLSKKDLDSISTSGAVADKAKITQMIIGMENDLKLNPSSWTGEEIGKLKELHNKFTKELSQNILSGLTSSIGSYKDALRLSKEDMTGIMKSGVDADKERIAKAVINLENDLQARPSAYTSDDIKKIQELHGAFAEQISKEVLSGSIVASYRSDLFKLSPQNINEIKKSGVIADKERIAQEITAIKDDYRKYPSTYRENEKAQLEKLSKDFGSDILTYVLKNAGPHRNKKLVMSLGNKDLEKIATNASPAEKANIEAAIRSLKTDLTSSPTSFSRTEAVTIYNLDTKLLTLKKPIKPPKGSPAGTPAGPSKW
jgi:hypothetical protein